VNLPKLIAKTFKAKGKPLGVKQATLTKVAPGTRTAGHASAGTNPTTTDYPCTAMIEVYTTIDVPGAPLVNREDRRIGVFGGSLPQTVIPSCGDTITIADIDGVTKTLRLVDPISGDGTGSLFEFVARK